MTATPSTDDTPEGRHAARTEARIAARSETNPDFDVDAARAAHRARIEARRTANAATVARIDAADVDVDWLRTIARAATALLDAGIPAQSSTQQACVDALRSALVA